MSQRQVQALSLLAMGAEDLREEVLKEAEKNPALEILSDKFQSGLQSARFKKSPDGNLRVGVASSLGEEKAAAFQEILESRPDERKSLFLHLTAQLNLLNLDAAEKSLCQKIIGNLDARGFYILAPVSLLDRAVGENEELLQKCIGIVQSFDPPGICAENVESSLLLQAQLKRNAPPLALFLLDGHLDFLNPPLPQKILEKIQAFVREQKKLSFSTEDYSFLKKVSEADIQNVLNFIKSLDPFPARDFGSNDAPRVFPDIFVERVLDNGEAGGLGDGAAVDYERRRVYVEEGLSFFVKVSSPMIPKLGIAPDFNLEKNKSPFAKAAVEGAKAFLEILEYRESALAKAACAIVQKQAAFFRDGPGKLLPLSQKDLAKQIDVHESTVSRIASSKYIQCQWGIFPVKYFFPSAVADFSKESVAHEIQKILSESSDKKMSDQKVCDALAERGIKVARRTVAKYRAQMQIDSSYFR